MQLTNKVIAFLTVTSIAVVVITHPAGTRALLEGLTKLVTGVSKTSQGRG